MGLVDIGSTFANVGSLSFKNFCVIFQLEPVYLHRSLESKMQMIEYWILNFSFIFELFVYLFTKFWYFPWPRHIDDLCLYFY